MIDAEILVGLGCIFVTILAVLAVGGLLWNRLFRDSGRPDDAELPRYCPRCRQPWRPWSIRCQYCGFSAVRETPPMPSAGAPPWLVLRRQISQFVQQGTLKQASADRLLAALSQEESQCRHSQPIPVASADEPDVSEPGISVAQESVADRLPVAPPAPIQANVPQADSQPAVLAEVIDDEPGIRFEPAALTIPRREPPAASDPAVRVREYAARRQKAAAESVPPPPPPQSRQAFSDVLAAFMEERNIRWGELVGGLLIVCCSLALVISFWAEIAQRQLQFILFNGVTAATFGMGMYAHRRMNLALTGRGLLTIATLLVPLNFLAIAAFALQTEAPLNPLTLAGEAVSVGVFSWPIFAATTLIAPRSRWVATVGIIVPSVLTLVVSRQLRVEIAPWSLPVLVGLLLCVYVAVSGVALRFAQRKNADEPLGPRELLHLLGLWSFATLLPLGLMVTRPENGIAFVRQLAPLIPLAGLPALAIGLFTWRTEAEEDDMHRALIGASLATLGAAILLAAVPLAWPQPASLLPVLLIDAALFALVALGLRISAAQLPAGACLASGCWVGYLIVSGQVAWHSVEAEQMVHGLIGPGSGLVLTPIAVLLAGIAALLVRFQRRPDAEFYGLVAAAAAVGSVLLVSWHGLGQYGDSSGSLYVYAFYTAVCLAAAVYWNSARLTWLGMMLAALVLVQGCVFTFGEAEVARQRWLIALLTHAGAAALAMVWMRKVMRWSAWRSAVAHAALASSLAAVVPLALAIYSEPLYVPTAGCAALTAIWLCLAVAWGAVEIFVLFQAALTTTVVLSTLTLLSGRSWYQQAEFPWLDPWSLSAVGVALSALALAWLALRSRLAGGAVERAAPSLPGERERAETESWIRAFARLLQISQPNLDNMLTAALLVELLAMAGSAAGPGIAQELSPRMVVQTAEGAVRVVPSIDSFAPIGISHAHALDAWPLWGAVLVLLAAGAYFEGRLWRGLGLIAAAWTAAPLLAARWEADVAVASALRWHTTGFLFLGSAVLWMRRPLMSWLEKMGFSRESSLLAPSGNELARSAVLVLGIAPWLMMAIFVAASAVQRIVPPPGAIEMQWMAAMVFFLILASAFGLRQLAAPPKSWMRWGNTLLVCVGAAPLIASVLYVVAVALAQSPILGPEPGSFFARIGLAVSYAAPVLVMAVVLIGNALAARDERFAFAGGLVLNLGATAAYLLSVANRGAPLDAVQWIRLAQLNAAVCAAYALAWLWIVRRGTARSPERAVPGNLLAAQASLGTALHALVLMSALAAVLSNFLPDHGARILSVIGGAAGWGSFALSLGAWFVLWRPDQGEEKLLHVPPLLVALSVMLSATTRNLVIDPWLIDNSLTLGLIASMWSTLRLGWSVGRQKHGFLGAEANSPAAEAVRRSTFIWSALLAVLVFLAGSHQLLQEAVVTWATVGVFWAVFAVWSAHRWPLYVATLMFNLAVSHWSGIPWRVDYTLIKLNIVVAALAGCVWVWLELRELAPRRSLDRPPRLPAVHHLLAVGPWIFLGGMVAIGLLIDLFGWSTSPDVLAWSALAATITLNVACLWDRAARYALAGLYLLGLMTLGMGMDALDIGPARMLPWAVCIALAAYALGTSYLWSRREALAAVAVRCGIPVADRSAPTGQAWLVALNCQLAVVVLALAFWAQFTFEEGSLRVLPAQAALVQVLTLGLLAHGRRRGPLQSGALWIGAAGAVALSWSWLSPHAEGIVLDRFVAAMAAVAIVTVLYGLGLAKILRQENDWTRAAQRIVPSLMVIVGGMLVAVLGLETFAYVEFQVVKIHPAYLTIVAATILGLAGAALAAAVLPGRDPLGLSLQGRMGYVYAAEGLLALLLFHMRLTLPWLFTGIVQQFWPLVIMAVAFLGVGMSELFRRRQQIVLAEPLERSGAILPLMPILAFWFWPTAQVHYSLLMLVVAGLYSALAIMRRSFGFGILAALAAQGGMWYLLYQTEHLGLLQHPQVWLIPPALCALVGAYLNRDQLSAEQMTSIRYLAGTTIYVSSTADIFLTGVGNAPWLPLVLGALSIAGILAGIALRVRAFLMLGLSFLTLSLLTILWWAAVDLEQTWIWWASGIVAGALLIALFAVFEKKRAEVLHLVEQLRQWQP